MEQLKAYIEELPFLDKVALASWLSQQIEVSAQEKLRDQQLVDEGSTPAPPAWMWKKAEDSLQEFQNSNEEGLSWEQVKALGEKKKSA
ncbi:MAG: hypothetical protein AAGM67_19040 [Bacteroidota bacterium]